MAPRGDRQQTADFTAKPRRRYQPANMIRGAKLQRRVVQSSLQMSPGLSPLLDEIGAQTKGLQAREGVEATACLKAALKAMQTRHSLRPQPKTA
jgi:hypothetical protein